MNLQKLTNMVMNALDSKNERFARGLLNLALPQVIPFNRPLSFKIRRLTQSRSEVEIPFKRANKNHLGGLHACAMATVGEYAAGILILRCVDPGQKRIVLKNLNVEYVKQGRTAALATVEWPHGDALSPEKLHQSQEAHEIKMTTLIRSKDGADLAHVHTLWQVKPWSQVRRSKQK